MHTAARSSHISFGEHEAMTALLEEAQDLYDANQFEEALRVASMAVNMPDSAKFP